MPKPSPRLPPGSPTKTVLLATAGLSPAVLTETVWALAQEKHAVIPDTIIVLTTVTGRTQVERQLFGPDAIWNQLRQAVLGKNADTDPRLDFDVTPDRLKVVHQRIAGRRLPLDELATREQNAAFADAIVDELWTHTSKPDVRVIASLAGGFKTMSALLLSAMQLLANPGDRVTHVLVGEGYESTVPSFYFPQQRNQKLIGKFSGKPLRASAASKHLQLIDLPVIPLRRWFEQALNRKPPSYDVLVCGSIDALDAALGDLALELGPVVIPEGESKHWIRINGIETRLSPDRYAYLRFFAERTLRAAPGDERPVDLIDALEEWLETNKQAEPRFYRMAESYTGTNPKRINTDSFAKRMKDLRTFLDPLPGGRALSAALPAKGYWGLRLSSERIVLR